MTQFDFQLLDQNLQLNLLYEDGVYIGKRKEDEKSILLYQYETFYVEVFYKKHRCFTEKVKCFRSTVPLDPYLEDMYVAHLVE
jgi:hypothetical protein